MSCDPSKRCPAQQLRDAAAPLLARLDAVLRDPDLNSALSIAQCHGFPVQQLKLWADEAKAVKDALEAWERAEAEEKAKESERANEADPACVG